MKKASEFDRVGEESVCVCYIFDKKVPVSKQKHFKWTTQLSVMLLPSAVRASRFLLFYEHYIYFHVRDNSQIALDPG